MCQGKLEVTAASQGSFLVGGYCLIIMFHVYLCYEGRFYVRRVVNLIKTANFKVNAYIRYKFGKMELLSIHANTNYFKTHNDFQEANT